MKLTILALALATYRCGASSRKLSAVAEAEEDYYYDAEVNTYYDDQRRRGGRRALQRHRHRGLRVRLRPDRRRVVDARDLLQATFLLLPYPLIDTYPHLSEP